MYNQRSEEIAEAEALSHEGDMQACAGFVLVAAGGIGAFAAIHEIESGIIEAVIAIPAAGIALGGLAMMGLGIRKIFQADKVTSY